MPLQESLLILLHKSPCCFLDSTLVSYVEIFFQNISTFMTVNSCKSLPMARDAHGLHFMLCVRQGREVSGTCPFWAECTVWKIDESSGNFCKAFQCPVTEGSKDIRLERWTQVLLLKSVVFARIFHSNVTQVACIIFPCLNVKCCVHLVQLHFLKTFKSSDINI